MKKKIALALASILALSLIVAIPLYLQDQTAEAQYPPWHWKIMLAQKYCNAWIEGDLWSGGSPIQDTYFFLECICELPDPQPLGQFVFTKIPTDVIPDEIHYTKYIDVDKNGIADETVPRIDPIPGPIWPEEPHTWYQHVEESIPPDPHWMVVVEVREQPFYPEDPWFRWQLMIKQHGVDAHWWGYLTKDTTYLPGTDFDLYCNRTLQCTVVKTPWCTVPNDIHWSLEINGIPIIVDFDQLIEQFPWTWTESIGTGQNVTLELTEVQMHKYWVMAGETESTGQLGPFPGWKAGEPDGVPFATRAPWLNPMLNAQNITFTQRDPITGIVKLGVPTESYEGLDHVYYSPRVGTNFRVRITLEDQGCGWLFTGIGKQPIFGSVNISTYSDDTGTYTFGPDGVHGGGDDELLAGLLDPSHPAYEAAGAGPPLGPCMQLLRGPDGIPGTSDDPIGRGDPDGPDEAGSSILYLPSTMTVTQWVAGQWTLLFGSPWPQLFTTATSDNIIIEPNSLINGNFTSEAGHPWEFFAGNEHPPAVPWKDPRCNVYVTYAATWAVLNTNTALGDLDVQYRVWEKKVRHPDAIADINCDEVCNIVDIVIAALGFDTRDEGLGYDVADPGYDARGDIKLPGIINIVDIVRIALDFDKKLF